MSENKEYRVEAEVNGSLSVVIEAKSEAEAISKAKVAIEGGEARIDWGEEGSGVITLHMPDTSGMDIQAFEE